MDPRVNLLLGWAGILAGVLFGTAIGLKFHKLGWLGGYEAWPRRLLRLAHVSFFGLGLLNIAYALTAPALAPGADLAWPGGLLLAGAVLMPAVCTLAAFRPAARHLFVLPVGCVLGALVLFLIGLARS